MNKINRLILVALASLILNGCASTLHFLFDVDDNLYYNNQEKKWEVKNGR